MPVPLLRSIMDLLATLAIISAAALIYITIKTSADAFFNRRDRW